LHQFIDSSMGGGVLISIVYLIAYIGMSVFNPFGRGNPIIRFILSLLYAIFSTLFIYDLFTEQVFRLLFLELREQSVYVDLVNGVIFLLSSVLLVINIKRIWKFNSTYGNGNKNIYKHRFIIYASLMIPIVIFIYAKIVVLDLSYVTPNLKMVYSTAIIAPVVEESMFRVLLPRLASGMHGKMMPYIIFALVFQLMHLDVASILPFFLALYFHLTIHITGKKSVVILMHILINMSFLCFK